MEKTVIELFAGVGGFRVGLNNVKNVDENGRAIENNDWKFVWANQWEPSTRNQDAFNCYSKRFSDVDEYISNEDIATVPLKDIPKHSLLVGGFPCQDYSVARTKSNEKGIEGKKGVLFWEIVRIAENKKTPFLLLENVDRLIKSPAKQRGRDFGVMLKTFDKLKYNLEWRVINAADYGCAQKRRRIFIFAWKKSSKYNRKFKKMNFLNCLEVDGFFAKNFPVNVVEGKKYTFNDELDMNDFIDEVDVTDRFNYLFQNSGIMVDSKVYTKRTVPQIESPITLRQIRLNDVQPREFFLTEAQRDKFETLKDAKKKLRTNSNGNKYFYAEGKMCFPDNLDLPGRTMLTSESSVNRSTHVIEDANTHEYRFITPVEAERLQSFPDNWTDTGMNLKRRYFMMGNALVTKVINRMEKSLSEIIENE